MNMNEIREKAKGLGVAPKKMRKVELVRAIQQTEGNEPCFQSDKQSCDQLQCCWRTDCLTL